MPLSKSQPKKKKRKRKYPKTNKEIQRPIQEQG